MNLTHDDGTHELLPPTGRHQGPRRIFVVEDDEDTQEQVVTALVEDGHDVVALRDGAELVECLGVVASHGLRAPDLIAVGSGLPRRSEIDLLEGLRKAGWKTPAVVMSWAASGRMRSRVELAAPAALLTKPFNLAELRQTVSRVLARAERPSAPRQRLLAG